MNDLGDSGGLVVIPAYNEAKQLPEVLGALSKYKVSVLVIDDGSTDDTAMESIGQNVRLIQHRGNRGYGAALKTGLQHGLVTGSQWMATLDADGAHDPADLPGIVQCHIDQNADITMGDRFTLPEVAPAIPETKRLANAFAASLFNLIHQTRIKDVACGFRVFTPDTVRQLIEDLSVDDFGWAYDLVSMAINRSMKLVHHPVSVRYSDHVLTAQNEFIDLLVALKRAQPKPDVEFNLNRLFEVINNYHSVTVAIGINMFELIPVKEAEGYLFKIGSAEPEVDFSARENA